jgi:phospholipase D1/2
MKHISPVHSKPSRRVALLAGIFITLLCVLALAWRYLPLDSWLSRENLYGISAQLRSDPLAPIYVIAFYTLSGLLAFPVIILIPATAMIFGPLPGLLYSLCGLVANASMLYAVGHLLGRETLHHYAGKRVRQISGRLAQQGFVTVALLRLLPVAPFFLINLISGASAINFRTYTAATVTGISPALIVMTLAGTQLKSTLGNPVPGQIIACALTVLALLIPGRWLSRKAMKRTFR